MNKQWVLKVLLFIVILSNVQIMVILNIKIKEHEDCEVICRIDNLLRVLECSTYLTTLTLSVCLNKKSLRKYH